MDDETIKRYQHLIRAAVNGAYDEEAQEFYTTAMIHIYGEVKQRSGYELCPNGTVKEHTTYYDTKQTVLTRCRIIGRY